jgi:disulfide bond formation protein DsbB
MNPLMFLLVLIVVYLGLISGFVIRKNTIKEIEAGKKYLIFLQRFLVLVIIGLVMFFIGSRAIWIILVLFGTSTAMYQFNVRIPIFYAVFGVLIGLLKSDTNVFVITASLVFLYGLVSGSLHEKSWKMLILPNLVFFVAGLLMFFAK